MTDRDEQNRGKGTANGGNDRNTGRSSGKYSRGHGATDGGRHESGANRREYGERKGISAHRKTEGGNKNTYNAKYIRESGNGIHKDSKKRTESGDAQYSRADRSMTGTGSRGKSPARENSHPTRNGTGAPAGGMARKDHGSYSRTAERKPAFSRGTQRSPRPVTAVPVNQRQTKKPEEMEGLASRRLALKILRDVTENGAFASLSLDRKLTASGLNPADRRLVSRLVYDTLEHLLYLDYALEQVMAKPDTDIKLRNILRLGACQILLEDRIPESAATNTCVELCTELGMEPLKGVCNGILRNLVRKKDELIWPDESEEPDLAASIRHSVPLWLVRRLRDEWGDEAERIMACHEPETSVTVHPNLLNLDDDAFEKLLSGKVWEHETGLVPHAWRIRGMADIGQDSDFLAGNFSIQNESSMMACMAVAPKRGWQILDCCAAPGGKTCLLSEMMGGTGRVQAWELHEHRTALIAAQVKRLKLENVRPMTRDATVHREDLEMSMDAVLLDAPCSGLGALSGKPDVRYRVTEESIGELTGIQRTLLDAVCGYVKPGGVLVYSTCSILKEENEDQIAAFLERHSEFTPEKLPDSIPGNFRQYEKTGLQLFEYRDHVEGFYLCRLRRKA